MNAPLSIIPDPAVSHRLAPLLDPKSIAAAGVSEREASFGLRLADAVLSAGYKGGVDFINPRYTSILDRPCVASFADLPEAPDLAILGVGAKNLEQSLLDAIRRGARSAVVFDACHGETASGAPLLPRLRDIAREAGIPICGGAGMGVVNVASGCVASFYGAGHMKPGGISLIAHSGSVFTTLAMNDPRFRFDLLASPGQEIGATIDEYIDFAVDRPSTKVIAVFMEAARNPRGFVASLKRARDAGVPVVVCKVGRSEESARMARSHTGALVGSRAAYDAVIDECGAIAVDTVDQLMNLALLCSTGRLPGPGGAGLVTDSGGLRELAMDLAAESKASLAVLSSATVEKLRAVMPEKLEPSNPLDCAADLTEEFAKTFEDGVDILAAADEVSMIGLEADLRDDYIYEERLKTLATDLSKRTSKPCFFYSSFGRTHNREFGETLIESGVACVNGVGEMLAAVTRLQKWADARRARSGAAPASASEDVVARWKGRLARMDRVDEHFALSLLSDFGVRSAGGEVHETWEGLRDAAVKIGYPVVLKTAAEGVEHKSDLGGVFLDLASEGALRTAYDTLARSLGSRAIVQPMIGKGIELAFGCVSDPDFGPLVMVAAGGVLVEHFADRQFAIAPVTKDHALAMIEALPIAKLLDGVRGAPASDKDAVADAFSAFSVMCASLGGTIAEVDVNPVIALPKGAIAVDGLIIPGSSEGARR